MATKKKIECPEKATIVTDQEELKLTEKQFESISFEAGVPLKENVPYLLVKQQNCGQKFSTKSGDRVSKRFWLVEMNGDEAVELRTVGIPTLKALYIATESDYPDAPVFPSKEFPGARIVTNDDKFKRVQGLDYHRALSDTSFIKADKDSKRAYITEAQMIMVKKRGGAWILSYEDKEVTNPDGSKSTVPGGHVKTIGKGDNEKAICSLNSRFYFFQNMEAPTKTQIESATAALKEYKNGVYLL